MEGVPKKSQGGEGCHILNLNGPLKICQTTLFGHINFKQKIVMIDFVRQ